MTATFEPQALPFDPADDGPADKPEGLVSPRLFQATGRRITPHAEWVEIQVKSAINRVQNMGFNWSINPYRGCLHNCVYCIWGDTSILMGDGTTKPLQDIRVGDVIYGTLRDGSYRHYVKTPVLAHWNVRKPAYRIMLRDGTELIASGDHRFLTDRGWKFVTGTECGSTRRPHLTTGNKLIGVGAFAKPPLKDADYKRGYLCGMIRGDGLLASYQYRRAGQRHGNVHQFRLALVDDGPLDRAQDYLQDFAIPTKSRPFDGGSASVIPMRAIYASSRVCVESIQRVIEWPVDPSLNWYKGFLAGIYDAEGGYSQNILRITNTDPVLIDWTTWSLRRLGFIHRVESQSNGRQKPLHSIRPVGGLREHLRFFHSVDPAIDRKRNIIGRALKSDAPLGVVSIEPIGMRDLFDITTGTGDFIANGVVSHNCFARVTHWYLDQDGVNDWSSRIFVKVNLPTVLRKELARPSWRREEVNIGTATDPYQAAEGKYRLTRQILEALRDFDTPAALLTKSAMVVRDLDVLAQLARGPGATVCFSFTTVDEDIAKEVEPDVPPPMRRMEAMRALIDAGVGAGVILAPVLPGITDNEEQLTRVVQAAKDHGAQFLSANLLHLGDVVRQAYFKYLEEKHPELIPEYERLYPKRYAPRADQQRIRDMVAAIKARLNFDSSRVHSTSRPHITQKAIEPVQLSLL